MPLNVSLRDYQETSFARIDHVVVDNWTEVYREYTNIDRGYLAGRLASEACTTLADLRARRHRPIQRKHVISVNPMGLAVFDLAITKFFRDRLSN